MVLFHRRQIGVIVEAVRNLFLIEGRKQETKNQVSFGEKTIVEGKRERL